MALMLFDARIVHGGPAFGGLFTLGGGVWDFEALRLVPQRMNPLDYRSAFDFFYLHPMWSWAL